MDQVCKDAQEFLTQIFNDFGFDLEVEASWEDNEGCNLDITGEDIPLVLSDNGELLDAFETLLFQVYGRGLERRHRFVCDADGFRQTRRKELNAMASFAAQTVREKGLPFTFGVLTSSERRAIHLALKEEEDLSTESVGDGRDRRLRVSLR